MTKFQVEEVSEFPPLVRGGASKNKEEKEMVIALLQTQKKQKISPVENKKEFDAFQQRIRNYARSINFSVEVRNAVETEGALYLVGTRQTNLAETNGAKDNILEAHDDDKGSSAKAPSKAKAATTSK